jgi:hypothetical protein
MVAYARKSSPPIHETGPSFCGPHQSAAGIQVWDGHRRWDLSSVNAMQINIGIMKSQIAAGIEDRERIARKLGLAPGIRAGSGASKLAPTGGSPVHGSV